MKNETNISSSISCRNARYAIYCKVHNDLKENNSIKQINEKFFSGGTPLFQKLGSRLALAARKGLRTVRGPITTGQYSQKMGALPVQKPSIMAAALPKLATMGLRAAISSGLNFPTARGNVTNPLKGVTNLGSVLRAGRAVSNAFRTNQPQEPQTSTSPVTARSGPKPLMTAAQLASQIRSTQQELARRSTQEIDLLPRSSRISRIAALRATEQRLKDLQAQNTGILGFKYDEDDVYPKPGFYNLQTNNPDPTN